MSENLRGKFLTHTVVIIAVVVVVVVVEMVVIDIDAYI